MGKKPNLDKDKPKPNPILDKEEPISGMSIERLNSKYRLEGLDVNYAFGLSQASYQRSVKASIDKPVENVSLALLTRLYDQEPSLLAATLVPDVSPDSVFDMISKESDTSPRKFGIALGRNASYAARAIGKGMEINHSSALSRLLFALENDIKANGVENAITRLQELAKAEAKARGISDIFGRGSWTA